MVPCMTYVYLSFSYLNLIRVDAVSPPRSLAYLPLQSLPLTGVFHVCTLSRQNNAPARIVAVTIENKYKYYGASGGA